MKRRDFLKLSGILPFLVCLLLYCGCRDDIKRLGPLLFQPHEKVCYIDDPNLIGRVIRRNGFGQYWVKWRAPSSHVGIFGGNVSTSPFTSSLHRAWELKPVKENL